MKQPKKCHIVTMMIKKPSERLADENSIELISIPF
jgi:hypothetical protein